MKPILLSGAGAALFLGSVTGCIVREGPPRAVVVTPPPPPAPVVVYDSAPPPPIRRVEVLPPQPAPSMIWVQGDWYREPHAWVWHPGYWRYP